MNARRYPFLQYRSRAICRRIVLAAEIAARRLSPVDVVEAMLARIAAHDPKLHAFIDVYADDARLAAEAAEKAIRAGHAVGPLHGVPIALKDLIDIEGRVTTGGSMAWRDRRSPVDGDAGAALFRAGHDRARENPHGRVRDGRLGHQPASRHAVEPVGSGGASHAGRVEQRLRRGGRCGLRALGDRHRYRRVGAAAGVLVRPQRA